MRWIEIMEQTLTEDQQSVGKHVNEDVQASDQHPNKVTGPLYGVPVVEVLAWVKSWPTDQPLPRPKARRLR